MPSKRPPDEIVHARAETGEMTGRTSEAATPHDDDGTGRGGADASSTPAGFDTESPFGHAMHRPFGNKTLLAVVAGFAVLATLAAIPLGLRLVPSPEATEMAGGEPEPSAAPVPIEAPASVATGPTRSLAIDPAPPAEAAEAEPPPRSFADLADTSPELPPALFAFAAPAPGITAFPPMPTAGAAPREAGPAEAPEPAEVAARPAPDPRRLDTLVERGNQHLSTGEIAGARLFFERAMAQGDPRGALGLARSHDPSVLARLAVAGLSGNETEAERWYRRARELGGAVDEANAGAAQGER